MRELGKIVDLGKVHTLGEVHNLGGGAVFDVVESGANPVQRILDSMPSELRVALVAWYSPKLQGITNEYLMDGYLSEEGTSILKDLSGNGYNMELFGMSGEEGNGSVDEDGNLVFDGNDDFAITNQMCTFTDFHVFAKRKHNAFNTRSAFIFKGNNDSSAVFMLDKRTGENNYYVRIFSNQTSVSSAYDNNQLIATPTTYNNMSVSRGTFVDITTRMTIARYGNSEFASVTMSSIAIFSRTLTDEESTWVTNNMII